MADSTLVTTQPDVPCSVLNKCFSFLKRKWQKKSVSLEWMKIIPFEWSSPAYVETIYHVLQLSYICFFCFFFLIIDISGLGSQPVEFLENPHGRLAVPEVHPETPESMKISMWPYTSSASLGRLFSWSPIWFWKIESNNHFLGGWVGGLIQQRSSSWHWTIHTTDAQ